RHTFRRMRLAPYPACIAVAGFVGLISVAHQTHPSPDAANALSGLHRYAGLVGLISVAHQAHLSPDAVSALSGLH
ncbi:hypothetical protein, partial [Citrobacter portucalensis]|uniref:hypothetical protein n=1 Tax=Citrobacter portucalensis TaxID=1639133 RepID=UPI00397D6F3B